MRTENLVLAVLLLGVVIALLNPSTERVPPGRGKAVRLGQVGKQIWLGLYNENVNRISLSNNEVWPDAARWGTKSSTDFFRICIVSNVLENFALNDFGDPALPAPASTNAADFTASNNAWCITLNCNSNTLPETPFLFSRNFCQVSSPRRGEPPIYGNSLRDIKALCPRTKPLGSKYGVVITFGGSMRVLSGKAIAQNCHRYFDPQDYFSPRHVDLPFLHP